MIKDNAWVLGLSIICLSAFISELIVAFPGYVYSRLGIDRDLLLAFLWLLPVFASFIVVFFNSRHGILLSILYIPIQSVICTLVHFLAGELGAKIDFGGISGLEVTFKIFFIISIITITVGCLLGLLFRILYHRNNK